MVCLFFFLSYLQYLFNFIYFFLFIQEAFEGIKHTLEN